MAARSYPYISYLFLKVDTPTGLLPIAVAGWIGPVSSTNFLDLLNAFVRLRLIICVVGLVGIGFFG